jgi:hypothetical protein
MEGPELGPALHHSKGAAMTLTVVFLVAILIGLVAKFAWDKIKADADPPPPTPAAQAPQAQMADAPGPPPVPDAPIPATQGPYQLYDIAASLIDFFNTVAYPRQLLGYPAFDEGVAYLCSPSVSRDAVISYALGEHIPISCMALEAMRRRKDTSDAWREILSAVGTMGPFQHHFAFAYLTKAVPRDTSLIGPVLGSTTPCMIYRTTRKGLETLIIDRSQHGEKLEFEERDITFLNNEGLGAMSAFLASLDPALGEPLLVSLENLRPRSPRPETRAGPFDRDDLLNSVGRVWQAKMPEMPDR